MNMFCGLTLILATVCISPIATAPQVATTAEKTPSPIGKLVDVGGYRVHLYCTGTGSPTVVILGAGYSFNWGLVQPEVGRFTQVCSYDHSGIGWSDTGPQDSCTLRVNEAHTALRNLGINGPYVLVGHSLGGLVARVYAARYPDEVAGMVFVDAVGSALKSLPLPAGATVPSPVSSPNTQSRLLTAGGIEDDPNFRNLAARDRELHLWASSQTRAETARRTNAEIIPRCLAEADSIAEERSHPLDDKPLVDVSTDMNRSPNYIGLQANLLSLSQNSKEIIAERSGHFVIIDRPDVVIDAIGQVVRSLRNHTKLSRPQPGVTCLRDVSTRFAICTSLPHYLDVRNIVDQGGNVISAGAVSGHPLLRPAAVNAARAARFTPTRLSGRAGESIRLADLQLPGSMNRS